MKNKNHFVQARKILGSNGSSTVGGHHQPFTTAATNPSLNISYQHPNSLPPSYTINESGGIYSNLTFCNNSLNPLTLQSSQQMDRLRFPLISQGKRLLL